MKGIIQFFDTYCFSHFRNDTLGEVNEFKCLISNLLWDRQIHTVITSDSCCSLIGPAACEEGILMERSSI